MKKTGLPRLVIASVFGLMLTAGPLAKSASYTWANSAGGNWNTAANWSPNGVPGGTDSAAITMTGGYTVTVNDTESVGALTLGASTADATTQTLSLSSGTFTVNSAGTGTAQGILNVSGATLTGAGALVLAGPLNGTAGTIDTMVEFNGGAVNGNMNMNGAMVNTGTLAWNGDLFMNGGVLTNLGTINLAAGSGAVFEGGTPDIDNDGQFNVAGTGTSSINVPFNNEGTVAVNGGMLDLAGGGTESNSFTVASGATLELGGGTFAFKSGSTILGAGNLTVSGGTVGLGGMCDVGGAYTINGGLANVTGACTITGPLVVSSGTLNMNGSGAITPATVTVSGGLLEGSQPVQVQNVGGFSGSAGTIDTMVEFNGGAVSGNMNMNGAMVNTGTLAWNGDLFMNGGVLTNLGTINLAAGSGAVFEGGTPDIDNDGQFNVAGTGTFSINVPFNNEGTVAVNGGMLDLAGGGTESNSFTVASGATLELGGGTFAFKSGSTILGAGNLTVSGGTVGLGGMCDVGGAYTINGGLANVTGACTITGPLVVSSGTLNMNGSGAITPATVTVSGGLLEGSQPVQVQNVGGFSGSAGTIDTMVEFNGGAVSGNMNMNGAMVNTGTLAWNGDLFMNGGVLTNLGTINLAAGSGAVFEGGTPDIDNDGQFNVAGTGTFSINVPFNNEGTVAVNSGTLNLTGPYSLTNGTLNFSISGATNFGALKLSGNAELTCALGAAFNGYSPHIGDSFGLITYGSESGNFSAFKLPSNAVWDFNYGTTVFTITVISLSVPVVTLQAIEPPLITQGFTLLMLGPIGSNYMIQASTDPELANWVTLTNFTSLDSSFYYTDTTVSNYASRVFRAVLVR